MVQRNAGGRPKEYRTPSVSLFPQRGSVSKSRTWTVQRNAAGCLKVPLKEGVSARWTPYGPKCYDLNHDHLARIDNNK